MALTRKALKAMGLTDEQVDSVVEMHTETVDAIKEQRDGYKADADKLAEAQAELETLKKTITRKSTRMSMRLSNRTNPTKARRKPGRRKARPCASILRPRASPAKALI